MINLLQRVGYILLVLAVIFALCLHYSGLAYRARGSALVVVNGASILRVVATASILS
jgi:ACR3 family arsenite efflux pump ArsB